MGRPHAAAVAARFAIALTLVLALAPPALAEDAPPQDPPRTGGQAPPNPPAGAQAPIEGMPAVPYAAEIAAAADRNRVDRLLLTALVRAESGFDPEALSRSGARGLTQLMPGTARGLGLRVDSKRRIDERTDRAKSLDAGARYLRAQLDRFRDKIKLSLAAYNAGPGAVIRHRGLPPYRATRSYVRVVVQYRNEYRAQLAGR
jgi:soluble lytic murein transglycosylase-like protein